MKANSGRTQAGQSASPLALVTKTADRMRMRRRFRNHGGIGNPGFQGMWPPVSASPLRGGGQGVLLRAAYPWPVHREIFLCQPRPDRTCSRPALLRRTQGACGRAAARGPQEGTARGAETSRAAGRTDAGRWHPPAGHVGHAGRRGIPRHRAGNHPAACQSRCRDRPATDRSSAAAEAEGRRVSQRWLKRDISRCASRNSTAFFKS